MKIKLSTGKEFYANHGILGIAPDDDKYFILTEGYDGEINLTDMNGDSIYTWNELIEIADIAIQRWNRFKQKVALGLITISDE